jgi:hypothetical protein
VIFTLVLLFCVGALSTLSWFLVQSSPRVLSMVMPRRLTFGIGLGFFLLAAFAAHANAYYLRDPLDMLNCFVQIFVGLWFMLATSAAARGSEIDHQMLRRIFMMLGLLMGAIIVSLYIRDAHVMAMLNMILIAGGFWVTTNFLQFLDRGRW